MNARAVLSAPPNTNTNTLAGTAAPALAPAPAPVPGTAGHGVEEGKRSEPAEEGKEEEEVSAKDQGMARVREFVEAHRCVFFGCVFACTDLSSGGWCIAMGTCSRLG